MFLQRRTCLNRHVYHFYFVSTLLEKGDTKLFLFLSLRWYNLYFIHLICIFNLEMCIVHI